MLIEAHVVDQRGLRDLSPDALDGDGNLKVMPASFYQQYSPAERTLFAVRQGLYGLHTIELVGWLRAFINDRSAIEVGAGNGVLAAALEIPATDSFQQELPEIKAYYSALHQPTVRYGANVEKLPAICAVEKYEPSVVVGCWVTHRYDPCTGNGNHDGVDEVQMLSMIDTYVFIGNTRVHRQKPLWAHPHTIMHLPSIYSRAINGSPDFVAIWER